ncbi:MAG: L,D-transpeptidase [Gammaproteobacteria bacterium]|nr:L,D-transpeptidase [Gammaproteobacteria bacterium]
MVASIFTIVMMALFLFFNAAYAKHYGTTLCEIQKDQYSCYTVKRGQTWEKLYPNEEKRDLVMRINRMNTEIYSGLKIAIPRSDDLNKLSYSPLPRQIDPPGEKTIIVSIDKLAFGAYSAEGVLRYWGAISSGRGYCRDVHHHCGTPTGKFTIYSKQGKGCVSNKFPVGRGGAPMPYCMFFHGGFALHGSYTVPGYNDSHGCVRLFVNDAEWLNRDFTAEEGETRVIINRD